MSTSVRVTATFPELPAAHSEITAGGSGSTKKSAISDALRSLMANPKLKGKRYTNFTVKVFILGDSTTPVTDAEDLTEHSNSQPYGKED